MTPRTQTNPELNFAQMQRAMFPTALVLSAISAFLCLVVFVTPHFEKIYADFGTELPYLTKTVLNLSRWLGGRLTPDQSIPGLIWIVVAMAGVLVWQINRKVLTPAQHCEDRNVIEGHLDDDEIADRLQRRQGKFDASGSLAALWLCVAIGLLVAVAYFIVGLFLPFTRITTALT